MGVNIETYSNNGSRHRSLTLNTDKFGRLRMSASLAKFLHTSGQVAHYYLGFDLETGRIALGSPEYMDLPEMKPVQFDAKRHYASVRPFYAEFGIPLESAQYEYEDKSAHWLMFRRVTD